MACGGVHNLCLTQSEVPFQHELYKMYKNELFVDTELVIENSISSDQSPTTIIKAHKFILVSRSKYFYNSLITEKQSRIVFKNFDEIVFKNVIDYMYIEDTGFIEELKSTNYLLDALKLCKMFFLKQAEERIEIKLKSILVKYSEALQHVDKTEGLSNKTNFNFIQPAENINTSNSVSDSNSIEIINNIAPVGDVLSRDFKGLFFLPNGNPIVLFDEALIEKIMKSCVILNFNSDINTNKEITNYRLYSQKNSQQQNNSLFENVVLKSKTMKSVNSKQVKENLDTDPNESHFSITADDISISGSNKQKNKNLMIFTDYASGSISIKEILKIYNLYPTGENFDLPEYLKYFNDKESSDVVLKVQGYEFYCHKVIF